MRFLRPPRPGDIFCFAYCPDKNSILISTLSGGENRKAQQGVSTPVGPVSRFVAPAPSAQDEMSNCHETIYQFPRPDTSFPAPCHNWFITVTSNEKLSFARNSCPTADMGSTRPHSSSRSHSISTWPQFVAIKELHLRSILVPSGPEIGGLPRIFS